MSIYGIKMHAKELVRLFLNVNFISKIVYILINIKIFDKVERVGRLRKYLAKTLLTENGGYGQNAKDLVQIIKGHVDYAAGNIYFINIYGTGDSYHLFSHLYFYAKEIRGVSAKKIVILSTRSNFLIGRLFNNLGFKSIECDFTKSEIDYLKNSKTDPINGSIVIPHVNNIIGAERLEKFSGFIGFSDKQLMSYLLSYRFDLKKSVAKTEIQIPYESLIKKNAILLIPVSNSLPSIEFEFWLKLADKLTEIGYVVYVNKVVADNFVLDKNKYVVLDLDLDILIGIANKFKLILGAQCGLTNILIDVAKTNNIILINNHIELIKNFSENLEVNQYWPFFYAEKFNYPANQVLTVNYKNKKSDEVINNIVNAASLYLSEEKITRSKCYNVTMSLGEIIDRISILEVKYNKLSESKKLNSLIELTKLKDMVNFDALNSDGLFNNLFKSLKKYNETAWDTNEVFYGVREGSVISDQDYILYGKLIIEAQLVNKKRIEIKNLITSKYTAGGYYESKSFN